MCRSLLRPVFQSFYDKIVDKIFIATKAVCIESMKNAAEKGKTLSTEKGQMDGIT